MLFTGLLLISTLLSGSTQDTTVSPLAVYIPVLKAVQELRPERSRARVVLANQMIGGTPNASNQRSHSSSLLTRLRSQGLIDRVCSTRANDLNCPDRDTAIVVYLGAPVALPAGFMVRPGVSRPDVAFLRGTPDLPAVEAHTQVDVIYSTPTPCRQRPRYAGCNGFAVARYRYYLRSHTDGTYRVISGVLFS